MKQYDYLIVGSGLFGSTFACMAKRQGKKCLVIDKRPQLGGNLHTSNKEVWDFVNSIVEFNRYTNSPVANYKGKLYNLPFNMNTFYQMWGVTTPLEAEAKLEEQRTEAKVALNGREPENLEEQAQLLIGKDIYETLIKGYTEKQWGRPCTELECRLNCDFGENREELTALADKIVYTGAIDEFYGYRLGRLQYRTVSFETEIYDTANYQGNAVVNYTDRGVPYTRIIEHKHFEMFGQQLFDCPKTVVSKEYSAEWKPGMEPYYPVNDTLNNDLADKYRALAAHEKDIIFGGRLAEYKYYDMAPIVKRAFEVVRSQGL